MDSHFNADSLTHHKSILRVSVGLQVLCEFVTSKKFQMRFWMMSGSNLFSDSLMLPHSISFLFEKHPMQCFSQGI